MPFSHRPITSQDEGAKGGGLWQSRCSKSQKFISPHGVISKEVIKKYAKSNSKETHMVGIFAMHFIYSFAHSQTFLECQIWEGHCTSPKSCPPECLWSHSQSIQCF